MFLSQELYDNVSMMELFFRRCMKQIHAKPMNALLKMNRTSMFNFCTAAEAQNPSVSEVAQIYEQFTNFESHPTPEESAQLMNRVTSCTMNMEEYKGYQPLLEEISDVAHFNLDKIETVGQALAFVKFFILKGDTENQKIWNDLQDKICEHSEKADYEEIFEVIDILKNSNLLSAACLKKLSVSLTTMVSEMPSDHVVVAMSIITSTLTYDSDLIKQLDYLIGGSDGKKGVKSMSNENISTVCFLISTHRLKMSMFLESTKNLVMDQMDKFDFNQLSRIAKALIDVNGDFDLAKKMEDHILKNAKKMSVIECVNLMPMYSEYECNKDLWKIFDIVVGRNIRTIKPDQIAHILSSFAKAPHKREKLFTLFLHKIRDSELSVADNCKIVRVYGEIQYKSDEFYDMMDKRLAPKIPVSDLNINW